jgi:hypothetical protein
VASLAVAYILLDLVLSAVIIPVNSYWGPDVATIVSILVASLVVGYVFAAKIHEESKIKTIGRITVLSAVVLMFYTLGLFANPYAGVALQESLESMYTTSGWTTWDWVAYSSLMTVMLVALNVIFALVFGFIGLYAGSMLKLPAKS